MRSKAEPWNEHKRELVEFKNRKELKTLALATWHSLCSLRKQITEPRALAALRFPYQIRLSRLAPAAHFEQSECHWTLATSDQSKNPLSSVGNLRSRRLILVRSVVSSSQSTERPLPNQLFLRNALADQLAIAQ